MRQVPGLGAQRHLRVCKDRAKWVLPSCTSSTRPWRQPRTGRLKSLGTRSQGWSQVPPERRLVGSRSHRTSGAKPQYGPVWAKSVSAYGSCRTRPLVLPLLVRDSPDELAAARRDNHRHLGETSSQFPSAFQREKEQPLVSLPSEHLTGEIRPTNTFLVLLGPLLSDSELESRLYSSSPSQDPTCMKQIPRAAAERGWCQEELGR